MTFPHQDQAKMAWDAAVILLTGSGMSTQKARVFFGKLLSQNRIEAATLLGAIHMAKQNHTQDPVSYLSAAAARIKTSRNDPSLKAAWT